MIRNETTVSNKCLIETIEKNLEIWFLISEGKQTCIPRLPSPRDHGLVLIMMRTIVSLLCFWFRIGKNKNRIHDKLIPSTLISAPCEESKPKRHSTVKSKIKLN